MKMLLSTLKWEMKKRVRYAVAPALCVLPLLGILWLLSIPDRDWTAFERFGDYITFTSLIIVAGIPALIGAYLIALYPLGSTALAPFIPMVKLERASNRTFVLVLVVRLALNAITVLLGAGIILGILSLIRAIGVPGEVWGTISDWSGTAPYTRLLVHLVIVFAFVVPVLFLCVAVCIGSIDLNRDKKILVMLGYLILLIVSSTAGYAFINAAFLGYDLVAGSDRHIAEVLAFYVIVPLVAFAVSCRQYDRNAVLGGGILEWQ